MMFWICGVPGSESMVKVNAPSAMVPGMRRLGMLLGAEHFGGERIDREHHHEQRYAAIGQNRADQHDGEHGALGPTRPMTAATIDLEKPESSITLPNTAPSRNTGKYSFDEADHLVHEQAGEDGGTAPGSVSRTAPRPRPARTE